MTTERARPTARDVAARAGVSIATVSYVLNGRGDRRVGAATQERVRAAADELGYAPNESARSLRLRRTERVALVANHVGVPTIDQVTRDLHAAADEHGYGVITLIVDSPARAEKGLELLQQRFVDGALLFGPFGEIADDALLRLAATGMPLVAVSNTVPAEGLDVFRAPEYAATVEAITHLIETGRRRIAFIAHRHELGVERPTGRQAGYLDTLAEHRLSPDPTLIRPGAEDRVGAYHTARDLLDLERPPDAIFAASDRAAISTIWAARDAGRSVPTDLAVIGSGNIADGEITMPTLSTVGPPTHDYADLARLLFRRLHEPTQSGTEIQRPWSFIRRGSG